MENQGILVADKDTALLKEVTDHFSDAGYHVETTNSAVRVISDILQNQTPVVLLGSDFDKKIDLLEMVKVLKKCNRNFAVILVSEEESFPAVKRIRNEEVFYYAMRSGAPDELDGIECELIAA